MSRKPRNQKPAIEPQAAIDSAPVNVDGIAKFAVLNQRTEKPITPKMSVAHAIDAQLTDVWQTVAAIVAALAAIGVVVSEKRVQSHCEFYTADGAGKRKRPTIEHNGKPMEKRAYRLLALKAWHTANHDGSQKLAKQAASE